jgi:hypothetical protein
MPARAGLLTLVLGLVLALVAGCSANTGADRAVGDPVTSDEGKVLAELLHRNFEQGGADFVLTAPFAEGTVLTLTGEVDFRRSLGRAKAVTTYSDGRADVTRTIVFTPQDIWFGDVPGLAAALKAARAPAASWVRRPLTSAGAGSTPSLVDVLVQLVLNLSSRAGDDPRAFSQGGYTWQGQRSIDGRLAAVYRLKGGQTVAVDAQTKSLLQYATPLHGQNFEVTITLTQHGDRSVELPPANQTVDAAKYPQVAQELGV